MSALLGLLLALPAQASELEWKIAAATAALVGTETVVGYRPALPRSSKLEPDVLASSTSDFIVVRADFDAKQSAWLWTLLPVAEGRLVFAARWKLDGRDIESPPVTLSLKAPDVPKDEQPRDIRPPRAARPRLWPWLLAALAVLGAWLAWRAWKNREEDAPGLPAEPAEPPETRARRKLEELRNSGLWERGESEAYYLELTDIMREYLEARYGTPATAMTSGELSRLVKSRQTDLRLSAMAREVLERADLVKFARSKPSRDDGPRDCEAVAALVLATTPTPPPTPKAEAPS